ncbi:DUF4932 domain-containing protein [Mucilaginibacter lacusdianchii]|uniref:DUF4932 domain-containing protein n=1 Tax=Mucilaginibacter lacusdianchii TaxID=2684211 RepID=UPI00131B2ED4|nr:DUF4932 domain-containing protein [Mucilaginibacter sp. JXJ CY 39]
MKLQLNRAAVIVLFAAASFFTSCKSYNVASRYTSKYINANTGKVSAQVPETFELGYTMLALTDLAQTDTTIINKNTAYYHELMAWFNKYKDHKGVRHLNADLNRNANMIKCYLDGLYAFQLNDGRVALKTSYRIDLNKVDFKRYALLLQNFYKETNFHEFYTQHQGMYADMVQRANGMFNYNEMQKGISTQANGYQVVLSPLINAYAGTMQIKGHTYNECIVFPRMSTNGLSYAFKENIAIDNKSKAY